MRFEGPVIVSQITQLARALSALTGKTVAVLGRQTGRKPMSEEGKAAIKAGLEKARAAKQGGMSQLSGSTAMQKPAENPTLQTKSATSDAPQTAAPSLAKKEVTGDKTPVSR